MFLQGTKLPKFVRLIFTFILDCCDGIFYPLLNVDKLLTKYMSWDIMFVSKNKSSEWAKKCLKIYTNLNLT